MAPRPSLPCWLLIAAACTAHAERPAATPARATPATATRAGPEDPTAALVGFTLAGERVDLGAPGPVRLVELWATWCAPCGPAAAAARPVVARHPEVVAYSLALDDRGAVERHVASSPVLGSVLVYPGGLRAATRRGLAALPAFVAIDTRGRVVGTVVGFRPGLAASLERLLSQAEGRPARVE